MPLNHEDALCPVPRESAAQCRARCPVAGIEQVESESEFRSPAISNWAYRKGRRGEGCLGGSGHPSLPCCFQELLIHVSLDASRVDELL